MQTLVVSATWSEELAASASFLAVVPPPELLSAIRQLQASVGVDSTVAPHITVKAQPGLHDPGRWRRVVRDALATATPFKVELGPIGWFGEGIVYLRVSSSEIMRLHGLVLDALHTIGHTEAFEYEGASYLPHLTVGARFAGATPTQLTLLAEAADRAWGTFVADAVVEFRRDSHPDVYQPRERFALGGR